MRKPDLSAFAAALVLVTPTPVAHAQSVDSDTGAAEGEGALGGQQGLDVIAGDAGADGQDARYEIPVATAYAAPMIVTEDTCMGSTTGGAQVLSVGVSVASTWQDANCRRIKNARQLAALGYQRAAVALLCQDDEVREAMFVAGTPCPGDPRFVPVADTPEPVLVPEEPLRLYSIQFDFDSSRIKEESTPALEALLARVQEHRDWVVDIEGHTDFVGTDEYNLGLSQRRAQSVVDWLIAHGVEPERLRAVGKGESEPIATNDTSEGRAQNRRVEITPHALGQVAEADDLVRDFR